MKIARLLSLLALATMAAIGAGPADAQTFSNFRNLLINGEALVANTGTATLTGVNTTPTYGADGFAGFANTGAASMVVGRSTANLPQGFQQAFSFQRTASNASTQQICGVQEVETSRIKQAQGQQLIFSFYAGIGSVFTGANSQAQINVITGTGTDEGLATLLSGWTGAATVINNQLTPALTTAYQRIGVLIPALASTVTELAVEVCWTPVGTASSTNDVLFVTGAQLEVYQGSVPCPAVPASAGAPAQSAGALNCATPFEHKGIEVDTWQSARYFQQFNETAAGTNNIATGQSTSTTVCQVTQALPVPMRATPTLSFTAGGLKVLVGTTATAITSGPAAVASSQSTYALSWTATTGASQTLGQGCNVQGSGAGTGIVAASARF